MENIEKIREIAEFLELETILSELDAISYRSKQENANLILPLVGEFSSGKTTLINALTDSKKLETATKPTTATIYEIHFGCDTCHAKILNEQGELIDTREISDLKNENLTDAKVVTVFDTSTKVPSTTVLVDTPGLSSPDIKHKQTLINFLPKADGILLTVDINQQVTRSLTDFIETMKLSKKPIFLILTKSDTKSTTDIESAKKYISDNCQIPLKQVIVVSATTDSLTELTILLDNIQQNKKEIIKQVDGQRIKNIINSLIEHIEELMKASASDKELDEAIRKCQYELDKIERNIDKLTESMSDDIKNQERKSSRLFEDTVYSKLISLVTGNSRNFDAEAIAIINNTSSLLMNDYKSGIISILHENASRQKGTENEIPLSSLENIDMSSIQMSGLNYNLDLNTMGHEYDGWIKTGIITLAAVGTVYAVAASGGAAAGAVAASTVDDVIDVADTVTDVGSMISNQRTANRVEKAADFISNASGRYQTFNEANQQVGQQAGSDKGLVDSLVGFVTDKTMSRPQRIRATRNYVDSSLIPEFKSTLRDISQRLVEAIRENLKKEAASKTEQKAESLNQLKAEKKEKMDLFNQKIVKLREYKTLLLTL